MKCKYLKHSFFCFCRQKSLNRFLVTVCLHVIKQGPSFSQGQVALATSYVVAGGCREPPQSYREEDVWDCRQRKIFKQEQKLDARVIKIMLPCTGGTFVTYLMSSRASVSKTSEPCVFDCKEAEGFWVHNQNTPQHTHTETSSTSWGWPMKNNQSGCVPLSLFTV